MIALSGTATSPIPKFNFAIPARPSAGAGVDTGGTTGGSMWPAPPRPSSVRTTPATPTWGSSSSFGRSFGKNGHRLGSGSGDDSDSDAADGNHGHGSDAEADEEAQLQAVLAASAKEYVNS